MKLHSAFGLLLFGGCLLPKLAHSTPRLLETYPAPLAGGGTLGDSDTPGPITFLFSEPIDPSSVVLPNRDNSNPNRSFEDTATVEGKEIPIFTGGTGVVAREGGRVIEIAGSSGASAVHLHVFGNGFRSLSGEPLGRDYFISPAPFCNGCPPDTMPKVRVLLPAQNQSVSDPSAPISIYLTGGLPGDSPYFWPGVDPNQIEAKLYDEPNGPPVAPLTFTADMPVPIDPSGPIGMRGGGYLHLMVNHPSLAPSPRPYVFQILSINQNTIDPLLQARYLFRFTVGPALAGDLNNDGVVTIADATLALQGALGLVSLTSAQQFAADISPSGGANGHAVGDGTVDVSDVTRILQRVVGLIPDEQWP